MGRTKRYGKIAALKDLDLDVARGGVLGYLGPNGAGTVEATFDGSVPDLIRVPGVVSKAMSGVRWAMS